MATDMHVVHLKQSDISRSVTLNVVIPRMFGVRIWLMMQLLKLSALIGGVGINVDDNNCQSNDGI